MHGFKKRSGQVLFQCVGRTNAISLNDLLGFLLLLLKRDQSRLQRLNFLGTLEFFCYWNKQKA